MMSAFRVCRSCAGGGQPGSEGLLREGGAICERGNSTSSTHRAPPQLPSTHLRVNAKGGGDAGDGVALLDLIYLAVGHITCRRGWGNPRVCGGSTAGRAREEASLAVQARMRAQQQARAGRAPAPSSRTAPRPAPAGAAPTRVGDVVAGGHPVGQADALADLEVAGVAHALQREGWTGARAGSRGVSEVCKGSCTAWTAAGAGRESARTHSPCTPAAARRSGPRAAPHRFWRCYIWSLRTAPGGSGR